MVDGAGAVVVVLVDRDCDGSGAVVVVVVDGVDVGAEAGVGVDEAGGLDAGGADEGGPGAVVGVGEEPLPAGAGAAGGAGRTSR